MQPMMPHATYEHAQREACQQASLLGVGNEHVRLFLRQFGRTQEVRREKRLGLLLALVQKLAPWMGDVQ
jgi:hypothetical protein